MDGREKGYRVGRMERRTVGGRNRKERDKLSHERVCVCAARESARACVRAPCVRSVVKHAHSSMLLHVSGWWWRLYVGPKPITLGVWDLVKVTTAPLQYLVVQCIMCPGKCYDKEVSLFV